jgi:hypothetical protein
MIFSRLFVFLIHQRAFPPDAASCPHRGQSYPTPVRNMPRFTSKVAPPPVAAPNAYEAERAVRIAANHAHMQSLGIFATSRAISDAANAERLAARNNRGCVATGARTRDLTTSYSRDGPGTPRAPVITRHSAHLTGIEPKDYGESDLLLAGVDGHKGSNAARGLFNERPRQGL